MIETIIQTLLAAAPTPQGESLKIRAMLDPEGKRPLMQAQLTLRGGGTFAGLLTTHDSGLLRLVTPQQTPQGVLLVDQYVAASDVALVATVIDPPKVARPSSIVLG